MNQYSRWPKRAMSCLIGGVTSPQCCRGELASQSRKISETLGVSDRCVEASIAASSASDGLVESQVENHAAERRGVRAHATGHGDRPQARPQ